MTATPGQRWLAGQGRWMLGDAVRLAGAASVPLVAVIAGGPAAAAMFLALGGAMALRFLRMPTLTDIVGQIVLLASAWWAATGAYEAVWWLDLFAHAASGAVLALLTRELLLRARLLPAGVGARAATARVLHVSTAVLALGFLWELGEWAGFALINPAINVGYEDTMTDLLADAVGGIVAALAVERRGRTRS